MLRWHSRGLVALIACALAAATVVTAPPDAQARTKTARKARAKKKAAPAKKSSARRAPPPTDTAADASAAAQPENEAAETQTASEQGAGKSAPSEQAADRSVKASAEATADAAAGAEGHRAAIDLTAGLRAFQRHLSYSSDQELMRPYDIDPGAVALEASLELYPGAPSTTGPGANIGLTANVQSAVGLTSRYKNPLNADQEGTYTTKSYGYDFGLKYRFPFSSNEVAVAVSYGQQVFSLSLPPASAPNMAVPTVEYRYIRPGLSGRFGVGEGFALCAGLGYLAVLGAGEMTSDAYFPHASVAGADVDLSLAIELAHAFELRPGFSYRAFFFNMNYANGDAFDVGGALDQYLGLNVLLAYRN
jgi:hypothetical protein